MLHAYSTFIMASLWVCLWTCFSSVSRAESRGYLCSQAYAPAGLNLANNNVSSISSSSEKLFGVVERITFGKFKNQLLDTYRYAIKYMSVAEMKALDFTPRQDSVAIKNISVGSELWAGVIDVSAITEMHLLIQSNNNTKHTGHVMFEVLFNQEQTLRLPNKENDQGSFNEMKTKRLVLSINPRGLKEVDANYAEGGDFVASYRIIDGATFTRRLEKGKGTSKLTRTKVDQIDLQKFFRAYVQFAHQRGDIIRYEYNYQNCMTEIMEILMSTQPHLSYASVPGSLVNLKNEGIHAEKIFRKLGAISSNVKKETFQ